MAGTLKRYVILKGLPKFILSREDTKDVGQSVEKTLDAVQNTTSVSIKSEKSKWAFNAGFNPINFNSWARYQSEEWIFSAASNLKDFQPRLDATHRFGIANEYSLTSTFYPLRNIIDPSLDWYIDNDLRTGIGTSIPFKEENISRVIVTTVSLFYSF